jgi:hypothetical protein
MAYPKLMLIMFEVFEASAVIKQEDGDYLAL